jgi:hypothetical protein
MTYLPLPLLLPAEVAGCTDRMALVRTVEKAGAVGHHILDQGISVVCFKHVTPGDTRAILFLGSVGDGIRTKVGTYSYYETFD